MSKATPTPAAAAVDWNGFFILVLKLGIEIIFPF
jgi:hypothetical protein